MQVQITIDYDTDTGDYEVGVKNKTHPGTGIEWNSIQPALREIVRQLECKVDTEGSA